MSIAFIGLLKSNRENKKVVVENEVIRGNPYQEELQNAEKILGVYCGKPSSGQEAVIFSKNGSNTYLRNSISYHRNILNSGRQNIDLESLFEHTQKGSILIRKLIRPSKTFVDHIQEQIRLSYNNEDRIDSLKLAYSWAFPSGENYYRSIGHDMITWAPSDVLISENTRGGLTLDGYIVKQKDLGYLLKSVILGEDQLFGLHTIQRITTEDNVSKVNPVWYACPTDLKYEEDYVVYSYSNLATAYWIGIVTEESIEALLDIGDLLLNYEKIGNDIWFNAVVRVVVPLLNNGDSPDFSLYQKRLTSLGKWDRVAFDKVERCFKAFVPGSGSLKGVSKYSLGRGKKQIISTISESICVTGDVAGRTMAGVLDNGNPLLIEMMVGNDGFIRTGAIFVGRTKQGKSTYALSLASQTTKLVVSVPLTREDFKSDWVYKQGGTVIDFNEPDADVYLKSEGYDTSDYELVQNTQLKLHHEDDDLVGKIIEGIVSEWYEYEKIVNMPVTFNIGPEAGMTRYYNFVSLFIKKWERVWSERHKITGERCLYVFDNYTAIPGLAKYGSTGPLGDIPRDIARNLSTQIKTVVDTGTNYGCTCWVLTSGIDDISFGGDDFANHFNLRFYIDTNSGDYMAHIFTGPYIRGEDKVNYKDTSEFSKAILGNLLAAVNIRLPQGLRKKFERKEFSQQEETGRRSVWTERVPPPKEQQKNQ